VNGTGGSGIHIRIDKAGSNSLTGGATNNDVVIAQKEAGAALVPQRPRHKCRWGLRLHADSGVATRIWLRASSGGLRRWPTREAAALEMPVVRATGDWRVEKIPWALAAWDSVKWLLSGRKGKGK